MLEEAKKELPEELSGRFDLNRFFAFQRDIIDDVLEENVPELIEDAMENPTGSFQRVSRFQTEKLMDIDRNTTAIKDMLQLISADVEKVKKKQKEGESSFLTDMMKWAAGGLGLGGLAKLMFGGKGGKKGKGGGKFKPGKTKTPKGKAGGWFKKALGALGAIRGGKAKGVALLVTGGLIYAYNQGWFEDMPDVIGNMKDGIDNASEGMDTAEAVGTDEGVSLTDAIGSNLSYYGSYFGLSGLGAAAKKTPAMMPSKFPNINRSQLLPGNKEYVAAGEKDWWKFASKDAKMQDFITKNATKESGLSKTLKFAGNNAMYLAAIVQNLYDFTSAVMSLPDGLSDQEYENRVTDLSIKCVASVGIDLFVAFAWSLAAGAITGGSTATAGTVATGGAGAPVAAAGGFLVGAATAIGSFVAYMAVSGAINYAVGDKVENALQDTRFKEAVREIVKFVIGTKKVVDKAVNSTAGQAIITATNLVAENLNPFGTIRTIRRMMNGEKTATGSLFTGTPNTSNKRIVRPANNDEYAKLSDAELLKKGLKRTGSQTMMGGHGTQNTYEQVEPAGVYEPADKANAEISGLLPDTKLNHGETKKKAPAPSRFSMGGILASVMKGAGIKEDDANAVANQLSGASASAKDALSAASGEHGISDMLGGAGALTGMMGALGIGGTLSASDAEAAGIFLPTDTDEVKQQKLDAYNGVISADAASATQAPSTDPNRTVPVKPLPNAIEGMMNEQLNNMSAMMADSQSTPVSPSFSMTGFPSFTAPHAPSSINIVALRTNGMADVYSHPQGGATMERSDRGGETMLG